MSVVMELDLMQETRDRFYAKAKELMGDTAEFARDHARSLARWRTGRMAQEVEVQPDARGWFLDYPVVAGAPYSQFNEYGTGIYREGGGGRTTPWVYFDPYYGQFFTTQGMEPQPFMRPGYEVGRQYLISNADRYFGRIR